VRKAAAWLCAAAWALTLLAMAMSLEAGRVGGYPGILLHGFVIVVLWPVAFLSAMGFRGAARISGRRRQLFMAVGFLTPVLAFAVRPATGPILGFLDRQGERAQEMNRVEQWEFLQSRMSSPQRVIHVALPFVVVEGGFGLELYGVTVTRENSAAAQSYLEHRLSGKAVTAILPQSMFDRYNPGLRRGTTAPFRKGESRKFGDVRAVVFVDGAMVNDELVERFGNGKEWWLNEYKQFQPPD